MVGQTEGAIVTYNRSLASAACYRKRVPHFYGDSAIRSRVGRPTANYRADGACNRIEPERLVSCSVIWAGKHGWIVLIGKSLKGRVHSNSSSAARDAECRTTPSIFLLG